MAGSNLEFWKLLERIGRAADIYALRSAMLAALHEIGFEAVYVLAPVAADPSVGRVLTNLGFDPAWEALYRERFQRIDPLPLIALNRQSAFNWREDVDRQMLTGEQSEYLDGLAAFGMAEGYAVPCFGPFARHAFFGIGRARSPDRFTSENRLKVEVCARVVFQRYAAFARPYIENPPALSPREMEVLRWIGEGKSNAVIADILEISRSSVDSYVQRLFAKLGVSDRISASLRGLALGLIVSGDYPKESR
ncbi:autoinducer binding domain-containing protein [Pelagerythrobacter sp.]|uniref:helix-turn-helix transcriptional regulator n=1 Tax=Pelagerythrobacter sp. TaxID=2800702 RepID=UPI0035ADA010